ncbi:Small-conductance mechanosensitive channel [Aliiroseovarius sediminilitoris]|uniref:Small-conductance mechanosensitive channel n=1 Tax=Aliiroseovarius sediminilitoris TaxID=1173584 RepID=A0A1I0Q970_9RHOB|nr:mechanosensitive ion channel domain-containing protein [Aliiroseovarius sediminilitoris]SEW23563.1 Small-conductance mechanosensitive channel [Aliiroseovarius sediminilitoris]
MNSENYDLTKLFNEVSSWTFVQIGLVIVLTSLLYQLLRFVVPRVAEHLPARFRLPALNLIPLARLTLFVVAVVLIIPMVFNVTLKNFVLVLGTVGVALGFAIKDWATSAVAGIVAIFERPYRSGDWIRIGDDYGEVIDIHTRSVKIRTADDDVVTIPHSRIWSENISNANDGAKTLMCIAEFMVAPDKPTAGIIDILTDVAHTSPYLDWARPVKVIMHNEVYATRVRLKAYPFELRDQFNFTTDLTARGRDALINADIKIVSTPEFGATQ